MSGTDTDSSSESEINQFKEAVDTEFLRDEFYNPEKKSKEILNEEKSEEKKNLPSLRNSQKDDYSWNPYNIRVTPQFRSYVAKQLTKVLDKAIDDTDAFQNPVQNCQESDAGGVKLLSTSRTFVSVKTLDNDSRLINKKNKSEIKKRKCDDEGETDSSEEERRIKEVAVSPEWILSGEEVKHWAPLTKGEVEVIQLSCKKKKKKKKKHKE